MTQNSLLGGEGQLPAPFLTLVIGHYGVGKTNLSLNIARALRAVAPRVTLVDLDIVNPYFRTTDNRDFLDACNVEVLGPVYGGSNLDTPSLPPGVDEALEGASDEHLVLVDVGGDPDGARALGRYAGTIAARPYRMVYVANFRRPETATVAANLALLRGIEESSGLAVTALVGNTHLKEFTMAEDIVAAASLTHELAGEAHLPLLGVTAPVALVGQVEALLAAGGNDDICVYPVEALVTTPWET
jgi:hypothetical protein